MRLDIFVASKLGSSRSYAAKLIDGGLVKLDGTVIIKAGLEVSETQDITVDEPPIVEKRQNLLVPTVIYEDDAILILDKPQGLIIHDAESVKETTLVDWLKSNGYALAQNTGDNREGIVHRLDKETSGLLAIAKTDVAATALKEQLQTREMGRYYMALITPTLNEPRTIDAPLARHPKNRLRRAVVKDGRESKTLFAPIASSKNISLIAVKLYTGRTHQIRAHLSSFGRNVLGDSLYGFKTFCTKITPIALHAGFMRLKHPVSQEIMEFVAEPPQEFQREFKEIFNEKIISAGLLPSFFDGLL